MTKRRSGEAYDATSIFRPAGGALWMVTQSRASALTVPRAGTGGEVRGLECGILFRVRFLDSRGTSAAMSVTV